MTATRDLYMSWHWNGISKCKHCLLVYVQVGAACPSGRVGSTADPCPAVGQPTGNWQHVVHVLLYLLQTIQAGISVISVEGFAHISFSLQIVSVAVHDAVIITTFRRSFVWFFFFIWFYLSFIFIFSFSCLLHFPLYFCPQSPEKFAKEWVSVSDFFSSF